MSPAAHGPVSTAKRQSCDRCHDQKLRCTRSANSHKNSPCDRCLRKGASCVYGHSLPKGRPSLYRLGESITGSCDPPKPRAESWAAPETSPTTPPRRQSEISPSTLRDNPDIPTRADQQQGGDGGPRWSVDFPGNQHHDLDMDISDSCLALPGLTTGDMDIWATLSDDYSHSDLLSMAPVSGFSLEPAPEAPSLTHIQSSRPFPHRIESASASDNVSPRGGNNPGHDSGRVSGRREYGSADSSGIGSPAAMNAVDSFQLGMTHLSQLSTHLTHLLSSSRSFLSESLMKQ
jgi:hypothetical protein